jgi:hypothetical protein
LLSQPGAPVNPGDVHAALGGQDSSQAAQAFVGLMASAAMVRNAIDTLQPDRLEVTALRLALPTA